MVCIVVNHNSGWSPSFVDIFTGQGALFASAAEGFFAISGILVGFIYGPKILRQTKFIVLKIWKRAGLLYVLSVFLTLLFYFWNLAFPAVDFRIEPINTSMQDFILGVMTLRYSYGWQDFLHQYVVFMFIAPLAVWLCARSKWYLVLLSSGLIWLLFAKYVPLQPFISWQIIFMLGIIVGYYLPTIELIWKQFNTKYSHWPSTIVLTAAISTYLFAVGLFTIMPAITATFGDNLPVFIADKFGWFTDLRNLYLFPLFEPRNDISAFRLAAGVLWFSALYMIVRKYEDSIDRVTKGALAMFGRNSLIIFCTHGAVLFIQAMLIGSQPYINIFVNTLVHVSVLIVIFIIIKILDTRQLKRKERIII